MIEIKMNFSKSKLISLDNDIQISVKNNNIESIKGYIYMGYISRPDQEYQTAEITHRIRLIGKVKYILKVKDVHNFELQSIKRQRFVCCYLWFGNDVIHYAKREVLSEL